MPQEVYYGLDRPFLGTEADPLVKWWETEHLRFAMNYWEQRPWDPKFARWAKLAREELAIRKVTNVLLR